MRYSVIALAALIGLSCEPTLARIKRQTPELGVIQGVVSPPDQEPGAWVVTLESGTTVRDIPTDDQGHFETKVPIGVYTARIKSNTRQNGTPLVPFLVEARAITRIEVDPTLEFVYCSSAGERLIPISGSDTPEDPTYGLHRLRYDSFRIRTIDKKSLTLVIGYCQKTISQHSIRYKAAGIGYDTLRMFADEAAFEPSQRKMEGWGNVDIGVHGQSVQIGRFLADFRGGKPIISLTGDLPAIDGRGELDSGSTSFKVRIGQNGTAKFEYEDAAQGLRLQSRRTDCVIISKISKDGITFGGSALLTGSGSIVNSNDLRIVDFMATVKDFGHGNNQMDQFTISIPSLDNYHHTGRLSKGDIEIGMVTKKEGPVASMKRHRY